MMMMGNFTFYTKTCCALSCYIAGYSLHPSPHSYPDIFHLFQVLGILGTVDMPICLLVNDQAWYVQLNANMIPGVIYNKF
jgi:hypothetical protein